MLFNRRQIKMRKWRGSCQDNSYFMFVCASMWVCERAMTFRSLEDIRMLMHVCVKWVVNRNNSNQEIQCTNTHAEEVNMSVCSCVHTLRMWVCMCVLSIQTRTNLACVCVCACLWVWEQLRAERGCGFNRSTQTRSTHTRRQKRLKHFIQKTSPGTAWKNEIWKSDNALESNKKLST